MLVEFVIGIIYNFLLFLAKRHLKKRGVQAFRITPMMSMGSDLEKIRMDIWKGYSTLSLNLEGLGDVFLACKKSLAILALHRILDGCDWTRPMGALRRSFAPPEVLEEVLFPPYDPAW